MKMCKDIAFRIVCAALLSFVRPAFAEDAVCYWLKKEFNEKGYVELKKLDSAIKDGALCAKNILGAM